MNKDSSFCLYRNRNRNRNKFYWRKKKNINRRAFLNGTEGIILKMIIMCVFFNSHTKYYKIYC